MIYAVVHHDFSEVEGAYSFETSHVDPKLVGVRAPAMMGVDAADRAEPVLGYLGIELVEAKPILPREYT